MATWAATPGMRRSSSRTPIPAVLSDRDDAGGSSTRLMFTGQAWRFRAEYQWISSTQKADFESFYATNAALSLSLVWKDGVTYTVHFVDEGVSFDHQRGPYYSGYALFETVSAS